MSFHYQRGDILLGGFRVISAICERNTYSIYRIENNRYGLCVEANQFYKWQDSDLLSLDLTAKFEKIAGGFAYVSDSGYEIYTPQHGPYPFDWESIEGFCNALKKISSKMEGTEYPNLAYIEKYDCLLPLISSDDEMERKDRIIGRYLTEGLPVDVTDDIKLKFFCSWLSEEQLTWIRETCNLCDDKTVKKDGKGSTSSSFDKDFVSKKFYIPGREQLSSFFDKQVVDFFRNKQAYEKMGINTLPAILIYGPSGSGKTYAVKKLSDFLGFPYFEINSDSVGSSYIHDTPRKIAALFKKAIASTPSILVIDELETYLKNRRESSEHSLEEADEFLRCIPLAIDHQVLIIGMTNHIDMIDKAFLRKGRFDQLIKLDMPSVEEIKNVLMNQLSSLPRERDLPLEEFAEKLEGHPLSDVAFLIREASRRTVWLKENQISRAVIEDVLSELCIQNDKQETRKIGF